MNMFLDKGKVPGDIRKTSSRNPWSEILNFLKKFVSEHLSSIAWKHWYFEQLQKSLEIRQKSLIFEEILQ